MADGISIREFARREGVSHTLVVQGVKQGKLARREDGTMDPALVGSDWRAPPKAVSETAIAKREAAHEAALQPGAAGAPGKGVAYAEALRLKENWLALMRRQDYERRAGLLVEVATAQRVLFELSREQRDAWLAWPAKVAPYLAVEFGVADLEALTASLAAHVHAQLADLGEPEARFESSES
ncbi:hypothetical protein [Paraburkholderia mimosarum]|uniref:hypothetical protein n=1 Tax=Paraburkholderia mimosarum TaxID=312026 RepID=UPI0004118F24|nr:hypothetical protein [Paraburkholderia mimosarum]